MNTHRFKWIGVLACLAFVLFSCREKTDSEEKRLTRQEATGPAAVLPETNWNRTVAIFEPQEQSPMEKALFEEFFSDFISTISEARNIRVVLLPSPVSMEEYVRNADVILDLQARISDSGIVRWPLTMRKRGSSEAIWESSMVTPLQAVYRFSRIAAKKTAIALGIDSTAIVKKSIPFLNASLFGHYLEGRVCLEENTREKLNCAVKSFKEVLKVDSTFIRAWEGLAECYLENFRNRWDVNKVWAQLAQDAVFRAMRLDSTRGDVRFLLAQVYVQWGDLRAAERETRRALELDPNLAGAWSLMGDLAVQSRGQYDLGLESFGQSLSLSPSSTEAAAGRSLVQMGLGRYADAVRTIETALRFHPDAARLHSVLALALHYQGNDKAASGEIRKELGCDDSRPFSNAVLAMILASTGNLDGALEEITLRVEPYAGGSAPLCVSVAAVYSLLKRKGLAVQWLEKAVALGYRDYVWLSNDPNFDRMRQDQRFMELMEQIKTEWRKNLAGG